MLPRTPLPTDFPSGGRVIKNHDGNIWKWVSPTASTAVFNEWCHMWMKILEDIWMAIRNRISTYDGCNTESSRRSRVCTVPADWRVTHGSMEKKLNELLRNISACGTGCCRHSMLQHAAHMMMGLLLCAAAILNGPTNLMPNVICSFFLAKIYSSLLLLSVKQKTLHCRQGSYRHPTENQDFKENTLITRICRVLLYLYVWIPRWILFGVQEARIREFLPITSLYDGQEYSILQKKINWQILRLFPMTVFAFGLTTAWLSMPGGINLQPIT